jgi:hypothetical protein
MENVGVRTSFQMTGAGRVGPLLLAGSTHPHWNDNDAIYRRSDCAN